jgi:hypothetical protein
MTTDLNISVTKIAREEGRRVFTISASKTNSNFEYKIYAFDTDIPFKEQDPPKDVLKQFAIKEMKLWIQKSGDQLPQDRVRVLMNGGKITTDNINSVLLQQEKPSDLIRTNITIAASLFEWAKTKAQKEGTSFSDLASRGLITLKDSDKEINAWLKEQGAYFRKKLGDVGSYEIFHYLPNNYTEFPQNILKDALQNSRLHRTGWPIGAYLTGGDQRPQPQEDGIKAEYTPEDYLLLDYWYAKNRGEFYFARNLESDSNNVQAKPKTALYFDTLVWRTAEALEHCLTYYEQLGVNGNERVKIKISLYGLMNRTLSARNPMRAFTLSHYACGSERTSWETETTLQTLKDNLDSIIYEAVKKQLVMFDFFVPNKDVINDILTREYRKSRI